MQCRATTQQATGSETPRTCAEIADKLTTIPEVKTVDVAGPGFINITLTDGRSCRQRQLSCPVRSRDKGRRWYSDPNPFKPLHAGHLYTTLVGDMIAS